MCPFWVKVTHLSAVNVLFLVLIYKNVCLCHVKHILDTCVQYADHLNLYLREFMLNVMHLRMDVL